MVRYGGLIADDETDKVEAKAIKKSVRPAAGIKAVMRFFFLHWWYADV